MDGPSFVPQYEEIFLYEIYSFPFEGTMPVIIDCGANIGLAVIWWRSKWPEARVVAFEPDPNVFGTFQFNTRYLVGVELHQAAIGAQDGVHIFYADRTDAGRLDYRATSSTPELSVDVRSLAKVLEEVGAVDLLKIDVKAAAPRGLGRRPRRGLYSSAETTIKS
jgi:FkbM family methyltransferase